MLTAPTLFSDNIAQGAFIDGMILELTDGVDTFLLGNIEATLTNGHVYNVMESKPTWEQSIDDITNDWSRVVFEVTLTNIWYRKDSNGDKVRLSEILQGISGQVANLYLLNNPEAGSLSDCLKQFVGEFSRIVSYTETSIRIELLDAAGFLFKQLATESMKDITGSSPNTKSRLLKAPLVYGRFQREPIQMGLSKAPIFDFDGNEFLISNHVIYGWKNLYVVNGADVPPFLVDPSYSATGNTPSPETYPSATWFPDDSGGLITSEVFTVNTAPENTTPPISQASKYGGTLVNYLAYDNDVDTKAKFVPDSSTFQEIPDIGFTGNQISAHQMTSLLGFEIDAADRLKNMFNDSEIPAKLYFNYVNFIENPDIDFLEQGDFGSGAENFRPSLWFSTEIIYNTSPNLFAEIARQQNANALAAGSGINFQPIAQSAWQQVGFLTRDDIQDSNRDYGLILKAIVTGLDYATFGDIPESETYFPSRWLFEIGEITLTLQGEFSQDLNEQSDAGMNAPHGFVACLGRTFGAWIDDAGWVGTANSWNFNQGEMIQNPSTIIASLLIDEAGKTVSDIDQPSFVDAMSYPVLHRINIIDEKLTIKDIIKTLSNQSLGTFVWTAADKGRFIPLRTTAETSATADLTIRYDDILNGQISVTDTDSEKIVNHLTIKSRWLEEESRFADEDIYTNQTSIDQFGGTGVGERKQILEFKQINSYDNSATIVSVPDWLALHFIDADEVSGTQQDDGYWAKQRGIIQLTTINHRGSLLEVGDVIELDDTTVDPHVLFKTASWSSKQFIILAITQSGETTTIEGKERTSVYNMVAGMRSISELLA